MSKDSLAKCYRDNKDYKKKNYEKYQRLSEEKMRQYGYERYENLLEDEKKSAQL